MSIKLRKTFELPRIGILKYKNAYSKSKIQVNLCQKLSFLNQLTHNMTRECSLNSEKNTSSQHVVYNFFFVCFCFDIQNNIYILYTTMNNLSSYCGLTDSRMRASDIDLPVQKVLQPTQT